LSQFVIQLTKTFDIDDDLLMFCSSDMDLTMVHGFDQKEEPQEGNLEDLTLLFFRFGPFFPYPFLVILV
jgi:hypothetical protein